MHQIKLRLRILWTFWGEKQLNGQQPCGRQVLELLILMRFLLRRWGECLITQFRAQKQLPVYSHYARAHSLQLITRLIFFFFMAAEMGSSKPAIISFFKRGLSDRLHDKLASREKPSSLKQLISLAIQLDNQLREREREKSSSSCRPASLTSSQLTQPLPWPQSSPRLTWTDVIFPLRRNPCRWGGLGWSPRSVSAGLSKVYASTAVSPGTIPPPVWLCQNAWLPSE